MKTPKQTKDRYVSDGDWIHIDHEGDRASGWVTISNGIAYIEAFNTMIRIGRCQRGEDQARLLPCFTKLPPRKSAAS